MKHRVEPVQIDVACPSGKGVQSEREMYALGAGSDFCVIKNLALA
jgi:hypothetical protein